MADEQDVGAVYQIQMRGSPLCGRAPNAEQGSPNGFSPLAEATLLRHGVEAVICHFPRHESGVSKQKLDHFVRYLVVTPGCSVGGPDENERRQNQRCKSGC